MSRLIRHALSNAYAAAGGIQYSGPAVDTSDIGGWTVFTPVTAVAIGGFFNTAAQTGTRLIYISHANGLSGGTINGAVGSTSTPPFGPTIGGNVPSQSWPDVYFWNGAAIIDSSGSTTNNLGLAYGTDPFQPNEAAIKPFASYGFCQARTSGQEIGTGIRNNGATFNAGGRTGFPDWWLWRRAETYDLAADCLAFRQAWAPGDTATGDNLLIPRGPTFAAQPIMGAYGVSTGARPHITNPTTGGFIFQGSTGSLAAGFAAWVSIHLEASNRSGPAGNNPITISYQDGARFGNHILWEDVWTDKSTNWNCQSGNNNVWRFKRCLLTNHFLDAAVNVHIQGWFWGDGAGSQFQVDGCILARNGMHNGDPTIPGNFPNVAFDVFSRNMYLSGACDQSNSYFRDSVSIVGASGDQFRLGMMVERSFFLQGAFLAAANGDRHLTIEAPPAINASGASGHIIDCVQQTMFPGATNDPTGGHPGWGMEIGGGAYRVDAWRNIVTRAGQGRATAPNFAANYVSWAGNQFQQQVYPTTLCRFRGNILDSGTNTYVALLQDGPRSPLDAGYFVPYPGLVSNRIDHNIGVYATANPLFVASNVTGFGSVNGASTGARVNVNASDYLSSLYNTVQKNPLLSLAVVGTPPAENVKITSIDGTNFSVFGQVSGAQTNAVINVPYNNGKWSFTIQDQGVAYAVGEQILFCNAPSPPVSAGETTDMTGNKTYTSWASAATAHGFVDTDRTLATYLQALGFTLFSGDTGTGFDGLLTYLSIITDPATGMRKGQWRRDMTGPAIINYIRQGFSMAAVPM